MSLHLDQRPDTRSYNPFSEDNLPPSPPGQQPNPATWVQPSLWSMPGAIAQGGFVSAADSARTQVQGLFQEHFGDLAADKQAFHTTLSQVFGGNYDRAQAERFRQAALVGDFSWAPPVRFVDGQSLHGANGAYDAQAGLVYINSELRHNPALAASTYVEEAGHHLDARINTTDTLGDEGELFRRVLSGEKLAPSEVAAIRAENDHGVVNINGQSVKVEFSLGKIVKGVKKAVGGVVDGVKKAIGGVADGVKQVVGRVKNTVGKVFGGVTHFFGKIGGTIGKVLGPIGQVFKKLAPIALTIGSFFFPPLAASRLGGILSGVFSKGILGSLIGKIAGSKLLSGVIGKVLGGKNLLGGLIGKLVGGGKRILGPGGLISRVADRLIGHGQDLLGRLFGRSPLGQLARQGADRLLQQALDPARLFNGEIPGQVSNPIPSLVDPKGLLQNLVRGEVSRLVQPTWGNQNGLDELIGVHSEAALNALLGPHSAVQRFVEKHGDKIARSLTQGGRPRFHDPAIRFRTMMDRVLQRVVKCTVQSVEHALRVQGGSSVTRLTTALERVLIRMMPSRRLHAAA